MPTSDGAHGKRPDLKISTLSELGLGLAPATGGRRYRAFPNLSHPRWLLPAAPRLFRASLDLVVPYTRKGRAAKRLIAAGIYRGSPLALDEDGLMALEGALARKLDRNDVRLAFYTGGRGPYRKTTALVMTAAAASVAYAKIALHQAARDALGHERDTLLRLARISTLEDQVPVLIAQFNLGDRLVLATTAGPPDRGPNRPGRAHETFLHDLHEAFAKFESFENSVAWTRMAALAAQLAPALDAPWRERCRHALDRLHGDLGTSPMPLTLGHRDFCPWNTRMGSRGLFVFDWETAAPVLPLHDAFHFEAMQAALRNRPYRPDRDFLRRLLTAIWPDGRSKMTLLHLAYLLDTALFYADSRARGPDVGQDGTLDWFGRAIDSWFDGRHAIT